MGRKKSYEYLLKSLDEDVLCDPKNNDILEKIIVSVDGDFYGGSKLFVNPKLVERLIYPTKGEIIKYVDVKTLENNLHLIDNALDTGLLNLHKSNSYVDKIEILKSKVIIRRLIEKKATPCLKSISGDFYKSNPDILDEMIKNDIYIEPDDVEIVERYIELGKPNIIDFFYKIDKYPELIKKAIEKGYLNRDSRNRVASVILSSSSLSRQYVESDCEEEYNSLIDEICLNLRRKESLGGNEFQTVRFLLKSGHGNLLVRSHSGYKVMFSNETINLLIVGGCPNIINYLEKEKSDEGIINKALEKGFSVDKDISDNVVGYLSLHPELVLNLIKRGNGNAFLCFKDDEQYLTQENLEFALQNGLNDEKVKAYWHNKELADMLKKDQRYVLKFVQNGGVNAINYLNEKSLTEHPELVELCLNNGLEKIDSYPLYKVINSNSEYLKKAVSMGLITSSVVKSNVDYINMYLDYIGKSYISIQNSSSGISKTSFDFFNSIPVSVLKDNPEIIKRFIENIDDKEHLSDYQFNFSPFIINTILNNSELLDYYISVCPAFINEIENPTREQVLSYVRIWRDFGYQANDKVRKKLEEIFNDDLDLLIEYSNYTEGRIVAFAGETLLAAHPELFTGNVARVSYGFFYDAGIIGYAGNGFQKVIGSNVSLIRRYMKSSGGYVINLATEDVLKEHPELIEEAFAAGYHIEFANKRSIIDYNPELIKKINLEDIKIGDAVLQEYIFESRELLEYFSSEDNNCLLLDCTPRGFFDNPDNKWLLEKAKERSYVITDSTPEYIVDILYENGFDINISEKSSDKLKNLFWEKAKEKPSLISNLSYPLILENLDLIFNILKEFTEHEKLGIIFGEGKQKKYESTTGISEVVNDERILKILINDSSYFSDLKVLINFEKLKNNNELMNEFILKQLKSYILLDFEVENYIDTKFQLVYKFIDEGYYIMDSSPSVFKQFKYIKYAVEKGQIGAINYLDISSINDNEKQELDELVFKLIDNGYEISNNSPNYLKQFKYIKYAVDKGNIYAFKLLDLKSITDEDLDRLSKGQLQCLKIYNQLVSKSSSCANDFFDFFAKNMENINTDGILLSEILESNFDLTSELSIIDSEIIKKDLSKEQMYCLNIYSNIESSNLKQKFKNYTIDHPNLSIEQISSIAEIFARISKSNSLEIRKLEDEIASSILQLDNPIYRFEQIEDVFLKNNLPTVGKVYKVFEIMHPNFKGFIFNNGVISPILSGKSNYGREVIVFADLVRSFMGSNNRSMNNYLNNLEIGNKLFIGISEGRLSYEELSSEQIEVLQEFVSHLNTLFNNTQKGKADNNKELTGNIIEDIRFLKSLFSVDGKLEYDLPDRIIKMYCHFAGIDTLEQAKQYVKKKVKEADERGRKYAEGEFTLQEGDFVKGIKPSNTGLNEIDACLTVLPLILQNGSNSKEYLGSSADTDRTPLDTDCCVVLENGSIAEGIVKTGNSGYGPVYFVLKNRDNRFTITRRSPKEKNQEVDTKLDLTRLEAFYTGVIGDTHYGIRTGFASSEIDYIVVNSYDNRIGLEIAMNGFYIPVVDRQGKLVFSPDEYDMLRSKMNGLSYYGIEEYDISSELETPEILKLASKISISEREVVIKRNTINGIISEVIKKYGLKLKEQVDGDIQEGYVELIDTGSTGRGTNLPGDGDFDYMMRFDRAIMDNPDLLDKIKNDLLNAFNNGNSGVIGTGDFRLKGVNIEGLSVPVDIDITFVERTDKLNYSTDMCISDRLKTIRKLYPDKYNSIVANIIIAKKVLKFAECYKPDRGSNPQGGLGGVGIENWILQNGGSFKQAVIDFLAAADGKSFDEFKEFYKIYDYGENHMAQKRGIYPHDNFVYNMSPQGFEKMKQILLKYKELCDKGISNTFEEIIGQDLANFEFEGIIDKRQYEDASEIKSDTQQILRTYVDKSIEVNDINLGQTGYMYQYSDDDKTYLVKAGVNKQDMRVRPARACVQECASILQRIVSPSTCVDVRVFGKGNVKVSVQEKIESAHNITSDEIIRNHTGELLGEYVCDYLLGNFDSDDKNFIVDKNGILRGIDKEQSFKYLLRNFDESLSLDFSFQPSGSRLSIYSKFIDYLKQNGLSEDNLSYLNDILKKLQNISDDDYKNIFKSYAYAYDPSKASDILSKILQRKKYFEANINDFINQFSMVYDSKFSSK